MNNEKKEIRYFSTFSGIGGFELGIERALDNKREVYTERADVRPVADDKRDNVQVASCVGYSEIDKYAVQIYQHHFPTHTNYGDITAINADELPDFDLYVGGFPCQAFSIAGKRGGFDDTRGTLFFDVARLLNAKKPRHFILENVKGLLSHDDGRTFKTIIATLVELGYGVEWQVLNSKDFGVPQNRERVIIVGHFGNGCTHQVFPLGENGEVLAERQRQVSPTVTSRYFKQGQSDPYVFNDSTPSIRKLTPTECERLQGFPDGWTEYGTIVHKKGTHGLSQDMTQEEKISDTQRYKTLGNAVTTNVIEAVMTELYK